MTQAEKTKLAGLPNDAVNAISADAYPDPDTTTLPYILTNHPNSPDTSLYWHIRTYFFKSNTSSRAQIAVSYGGSTPRMFIRHYAHYFGEPWTPWEELVPKTEFDAHKADTTTAHGINTKVSKAGDTMTGNLTLPAIDGDILIPDTRSVPINPGDLQKRVTVDFKAGDTIGLASDYYTVWTMRPWTDDSGGPAHQFAYGSEGLFYRQGLSSGWGSWQKVFHSGNQPQLRINNGQLQYYDGGWKDVAVSPIKSIQRGTHAGRILDDITITINTVNPAKCIVILNSSVSSIGGAGDVDVYTPILKSITSNSLVVSQSRVGSQVEVPFSWQLIEYN